ncbi:hypothetical protein GMORB2_3313 [Geosmithia morbida]|uniref:Uncharacterized protein n=1 Tax=Geosmithia morbida TaxID=1094350 RepID=A0A9P4YNG8_9HYPO|nr:uncharacterized protein GMORB2_3313 [Geosmithia morbida]KAF4120186.1 hypothetical protein GMORB2_3313 [Geosmithia morbida]
MASTTTIRLMRLHPLGRAPLLNTVRTKQIPYVRSYATPSNPKEDAKSPSKNPAAQFYKTFTRPVSKVLLIAVLTYQLVYFGWMKLETDEIRAETAGEFWGRENEEKENNRLADNLPYTDTISHLESKVEEFKKSEKSK